ncbi:peptide deformylase [Aquamicrobium zhengzhouense]|uniref:Peptide deformylase-like n=1 Tax=Aquamicrobium zhengzhouense TaxID=2781738 RepID=A0ABS0SG83_9HYPH|nr:peptide deformylase [Aquamicrobium zhengzhouense]MBI1621443.1 peptide deformylase [Aquamicrobium zhengzhouense]
MTVRPIVKFPDIALRTPAAPVETFDNELRQLADDLLETMRAAPGVGITGPHIGVLKRITVIELSPEDGVRIYVNPVIEETSQTLQRHTEGSVSMPGVTEEIERPDRITLRYQTITGEEQREEATGFLATCLQHEVDQLDGVFWLQRLSRLKRDRAIKKWQKLARG